jgi:dephospho-CoA kinase
MFSRIIRRPFVLTSFYKQKAMSTIVEIGITGSIGMGKSSISSQLQKLGFFVFDADKEVHKVYANGGRAVPLMQQICPECVVNGCVDRSILSAKIIENPTLLKAIEEVVHPLVHEAKHLFYHDAVCSGHFAVFYDIPLLFENRSKHRLDHIIVVTASGETQRKRVMQRPGMTADRFQTILAKQVSDVEKRSMADFIISTDFAGFTEARSQLARIIHRIIDANESTWIKWKERQESNAGELVYKFKAACA